MGANSQRHVDRGEAARREPRAVSSAERGRQGRAGGPACAGPSDGRGIAADVSEPAGIDRVAKSALDKFGQVDILVTNSGGPPSGAFESFTAESWESATRLLLFSAVGLARAVLPGMKERRWGRILNVTSIAVKQPIDGLMLSNSLRAAVTGFARSLANEVARFNVTVNNLMPGYTRTDRVEELARATSAKTGASLGDAYAK